MCSHPCVFVAPFLAAPLCTRLSPGTARALLTPGPSCPGPVITEDGEEAGIAKSWSIEGF